MVGGGSVGAGGDFGGVLGGGVGGLFVGFVERWLGWSGRVHDVLGWENLVSGDGDLDADWGFAGRERPYEQPLRYYVVSGWGREKF